MSKDIIDLEDVLERVQDDKELFVELLDIFTDDYVKKSAVLGESVQQNDFAKIKDVIHSIKGASGNISAKSMHITCGEIEALVELEVMDKVSVAIEVLDQQFKELQGKITEIKKEYGVS